MSIRSRSCHFVFALLVISCVLFSGAQSAIAGCEGTFFKTTSRKVGPPVGLAGLIDWTGDGKPDFFKFQSNPVFGFMDDIAVYPNDGSGHWDFDSAPIVITSSFQILTGGNLRFYRDYDNDNDTDVFVIRRVNFTEITVLVNNGSGTLVTGPTLHLGSETFGDLVDVNGDNVLDITTSTGSGSYGYRLGASGGSFGAYVPAATQNGVADRATGDFNGDGKADFLLAVWEPNSYKLIVNLGGGNFSAGPDIALTNRMEVRAVNDFNGDGRMDFAALLKNPSGNAPSAGSPNKLGIFFGQADGSFVRTDYAGVKPNSFGSTLNAPSFIVADLNGDGNSDIIDPGSDYYSVFINNGAGVFTRTDYKSALGQYSSELEFIDIDGDGRADIFDRASLPTNLFGEPVLSYRQNTCQRQGQTLTGNFDGDINGEIIGWRPDNGLWSTLNARWDSEQSQQTVKGFLWGSGAQGDIPTPGDFDGDGRTDYAVYRSGTGVWYAYLSSNGTWITMLFGVPGDIPVAADYNGGGKTDIAVFRPSDGTWYLFYTETQQFFPLQFGASGDLPIPADYDGDGKTDLAIFRPAGGVWYYLRSSDGSWGVLNWGVSTDKPVPSDYDGDGKADIAIFRDGDWYILRSSDNGFRFIHWGMAGDVPVPFHRSSAAADIVVFRPSTSTWFNYSFPSMTITLGGSQNVPVVFGAPNN